MVFSETIIIVQRGCRQLEWWDVRSEEDIPHYDGT
jgi:hypothetical protein